jgi:hypothetical protein
MALPFERPLFPSLAGSALLLGMAPAYRQVKDLPPDAEGGEVSRGNLAD